MSLEAGEIIGRYRIVRRLGAGGMGEVYVARDERLGREVAIKVLPEAVASDPERIARLEREARLLARLSHPNILVIHELGEDRGRRFLVTELLHGTNLRKRLVGRPLPWRRAVEIAAEVAEGLAAAHGSGVVHRDIKPGNVFLTEDDRVKILDFGLARFDPRPSDPRAGVATSAPTAALPDHLTGTGAVIGTPGYMSPEQLLGRPVDHRTDIFALGCLLHEMLTGRPAFRRKTLAETTSAILNDSPPPLETPSGDLLPAELARIVTRCLEKNPDRRYQSASDLAFALRATLSPAGSSAAPAEPRRGRLRWPAVAVLATALVGVALLVALQRRNAKQAQPPEHNVRVAVLDFTDRTGDPALAGLGPMLAHGLLQGAEALSETRIVPVPGKDRDPAAAAHSVGAEYAIVGEYYAIGDRIQINPRLLDVRDGSVLYAAPPLTAPRDDPAAAIEAVRQRMLGAVGWYLWREPLYGLERAPASIHPPTLDALVEYRRGWELFGGDYAGAIEHFRRAIELSPGFVASRVVLFFAYHNQRKCREAHQVFEAARQYDGPMNPTEQLLLDWIGAVDSRRRTAELRVVRELDRLMPNFGSIVYAHGDAALAANFPGEAARVLERAAALGLHIVRPTSWWRPKELAEAYHMNGEFERSLEVAEEGWNRLPGALQLEAMRAANLVALGRLDELREVVREARTVNPTSGTPGRVLLTATEELAAHGYSEEVPSMAARAADWYREAVAGGRPRLRRNLIRALLLAGRTDEACVVAKEMMASGPEDVEELEAAGVAFARAGDRGRARELLDRIARLDDPCGPQEATYARAAVEAWLGEKDVALELLRKAFAQGHAYGIDFHRDPDLAPLWHEPEFVELLRPKG